MRALLALFLSLATLQVARADEPNTPPTMVGFNDTVKTPDHALFGFMAREFRWRLKQLDGAPLPGDGGEVMLEFGSDTVQLKTRCHQLAGTWRPAGTMLEWTLEEGVAQASTTCVESKEATAVIEALRSRHVQAGIANNVKLLLGSEGGTVMEFNAVDRGGQ